MELESSLSLIVHIPFTKRIARLSYYVTLCLIFSIKSPKTASSFSEVFGERGWLTRE